MPQLELLSVCRKIESSNGSITLEGIVSIIPLRKFPATFNFSVAMIVRFERAEEGPHRIDFSICDYEGVPVQPPDPKTVLVKVAGDMPATWVTHTGEIQKFGVAKPANYKLVVKVDDVVVGDTAFFVMDLETLRNIKS